MRNKSNSILNGIFAVALLSAGVLAFHFLRTPVEPQSNAEPITALPAPPPPAPWLPRLAEPRAVLVLDVSGSIRTQNQEGIRRALQASEGKGVVGRVSHH